MQFGAAAKDDGTGGGRAGENELHCGSCRGDHDSGDGRDDTKKYSVGERVGNAACPRHIGVGVRRKEAAPNPIRTHDLAHMWCKPYWPPDGASFAGSFRARCRSHECATGKDLTEEADVPQKRPRQCSQQRT